MRNLPLTSRGVLLSAAVHCTVFLALVGVWRSARVVPMRMPGTAHGNRTMLVYSMGGPQTASQAPLHSTKSPVHAPAAKSKPSKTTPTPAVTKTTPTDPGTSGTGESALGQGNIMIALVKNHPRPTPDLSALPHGSAGDVVLDATIDEQGRITQLKVTKGFGGMIDQTVIATVQQWTFVPATRDGVAISSEQEILFHYERS